MNLHQRELAHHLVNSNPLFPFILKPLPWDTETQDSFSPITESYLAKQKQPLIPQRTPTGSRCRCVLSVLIKERNQLLCQQLLIIQGRMIQFVD